MLPAGIITGRRCPKAVLGDELIPISRAELNCGDLLPAGISMMALMDWDLDDDDQK